MRMLRVLAVSLVLVGCEPRQDKELLVECFTQAAYEAIKSPPKPVQGCCKKCTKGRVRSGDGLAWVTCPICPDNCECKK